MSRSAGLFLFFFAMTSGRTTGAYKILLLPNPAHSHVASLNMLGLELTNRGHQVHLLLHADFPFRTNTKSSNNTQPIVIERYGTPGFFGGKNESSNATPTWDLDKRAEASIENMLETKSDSHSLLTTMLKMVEDDRQQLLENNKELINHLESIKFDIAVVDANFMLKHAYLIPLRLRVPWITYTDYVSPWHVRVPWLPSFIPSHLAGAYTDRMSFIQRLRNTVTDIIMSVYKLIPDVPKSILAEYRSYGDFTSLDDLGKKSQLFILTSDVILEYAKPMMPNMIQAGGMTIVPSDGSTLSAEFKTFISGAKHGVILVTFGSLAASLPADTVRKFAAAFNRLGADYHVIWRLNNKHSIELPSHVMTSLWVPQNDLLGSGLVKLFITHGGNNGQFESVYYAVPMIGFPILGDQPYNIRRMVHKGYGLGMNIHEFTADELFENMMIMLTDRSYADRLRKASDIYRSAPETALGRASRSIEHVTKYGGDYLRSAGSDLCLYEYLMLDLISMVVVIVVVPLLLVVRKLYTTVIMMLGLGKKVLNGWRQKATVIKNKKE